MIFRGEHAPPRVDSGALAGVIAGRPDDPLLPTHPTREGAFFPLGLVVYSVSMIKKVLVVIL